MPLQITATHSPAGCGPTLDLLGSAVIVISFSQSIYNVYPEKHPSPAEATLINDRKPHCYQAVLGERHYNLLFPLVQWLTRVSHTF
jgi:hypothetical protein